MLDTDAHACAQPFGHVIKQLLVRCIIGEDDHAERESRIQIARDMGILSGAEAYAIRCGEWGL